MQCSWPDFLLELEESLGCDAVIEFECRGAFLKFCSRLTKVDRPAALSVEAMSLFGVLPQRVTLRFANGVSINLYTRHIEEVVRNGEAVVVSFRGEGRRKNSVAFFPKGRRRQGWAG